MNDKDSIATFDVDGITIRNINREETVMKFKISLKDTIKLGVGIFVGYQLAELAKDFLLEKYNIVKDNLK